MIRISSRRIDSGTKVSVAGKLEERHLVELQQHCAAAATAIILELSELKSADKVAIRWLGTRVAGGDEVLGASPYVKLLLERDQWRSDPPTTTGSRGSGEDN